MNANPKFLAATAQVDAAAIKSLPNSNKVYMKITQDVREYAAKHSISNEDALKKGMQEKAIEFVQQGAEIYHKA